MNLDLLGNPSSGGNCYLLRSDGDTLMLDAGLAWSPDREIGVDFTVPRLTPEQRAGIRTIVVTHPHEDHVGALPYLLAQIPEAPTIIAGPVTSEIIRQRLAESHQLATVQTLAPYDWGRTDRFRFQALPVPHSASESMALYIEAGGQRVLYSGDLRGSDETGYGRLPASALTDHSAVDVLMLEAVRADVNEPDPTLADLKEGLLAALKHLEGRRVIVSAFASNLTRLQIIIELAQSVGRHCYLLGRSMQNAVNTAQKFQRMPEKSWTLGAPMKDAENHRTLLLVAGAQGEVDAGLSRLIRGHYPVQARRGDGLIMSSTPIPGNESAFWTLVELAMRKGVEVITYRDYLVHLSGHSTASELQRIMRLVKPKWVVPFHGDYYRHKVMRDLGSKAGISPKRFVPASNGDRVTISQRPQVKTMNWPVDSYQLGRGNHRSAIVLGTGILEERRRIQQSGTVVIRGRGRNTRIDCLDCPEDVEELVNESRDRSSDPRAIRARLEASLTHPPLVLDIG